MPPKTTKSAASAKPREVQDPEEPLQAVVLADSFENRFSPFTLERPRCLLPLANVPLIEYTLEFLSISGVQEVYLYCGAFADQIEEYIGQSRWVQPSSPFRLETIRSTSRSIGDAMRDLDKRAILGNDFIVVYGDVIGTTPLGDVIAQHRQRRAADKNAIMTLVLREAGAQHRGKPADIRPTFIIEPQRQRCLHYEQIQPTDPHSRLQLEADLLEQDVEIRTDLIDCGIDICTPDVLALWSDNFDYEAPRRGFLHSVLKDYELNGKTIHTHIVKDGYAARVRDLTSYAALSADILSHWTDPLSPQANLLDDETYECHSDGSWREAGVNAQRSCQIGNNVAIGADSTIGAGTRVECSTVGRNCSIGRNCLLENAYIWDNVTIGDDTKMQDCIIASNARIGRNCNITDGALVSFRANVADGMALDQGKRLMAKRNSDAPIPDDGPDESEAAPVGNAFDRRRRGLVYMAEILSSSQESLSSVGSDESLSPRRSRTSFTSNASDESHSQSAENFVRDAAGSIYDSLQQSHDVSTIQLELQGLRMSANASEHQVRQAVVSGLVRHLAELHKAKKPVKPVLFSTRTLIERTVFDASQDQKSDQVDFLLLVQTDLSKRADGDGLLLAICNDLYLMDDFEEELFDDDAFLQWWDDPRSTASQEMSQVRRKTERLMDVIADDDEEEDGDAGVLLSRSRLDGEIRRRQFTTPPKTRKRKAADLKESTPPLDQESASASRNKRPKSTLPHSQANATVLPISTVSSTGYETQKAIIDTELKGKAILDQHNASEKLVAAAVGPHTPASMDSDDEVNSMASSGVLEDLEDQDSDISMDDLDFGDGDDGFDSQTRDMKPKQKPYEVKFKVYSPEDIQRYQGSQVAEVSAILDQPPENAAILLRHARWNKEKLIELYMDKEAEVLESAGLGRNDKRTPHLKTVPGFVCDICCDDQEGLQTYAMKCEHRFCIECYRHYLAQKITDEGEAARIRCPGEGCNRIVDAKSLDLLVADELKERYQKLLTRTYVDDKENLKWCPAPNCEYAIDCGVKQRDLNRIVPTVTCKCGHPFCFGCTITDHQPAPCSLVKKWLKKCADDSETANWISANTKECPKCYSTIEKNGGCNHMTCRKCKHEFCWMCMGVWSEHGTSWYNCNRYEEKSGSDARDAQAKSRQSLERYLHYYNRYANHEQSAKLDRDIALKAEKKMTKLQNDAGLSWIEVQFLQEASKCLQECRQTLKWTYAFAFYLARNNQTEIFEDNQKDLEMAVENLSEMFERPTDQLKGVKVEMMDKISYCSKRRTIVLDTTAAELQANGWKFIVDLDQ